MNIRMKRLVGEFEKELPKLGNENNVSLFIGFINSIMESMLGKRAFMTESVCFRLYIKCLEYMRDTQDECFATLWEHFAQNERLSQYFTPDGACDIMGRIVLDGVDWGMYSARRPLVIGEPTAGGGRTLIGALKQVPDGCMHKVMVHATELDRNVAMCCALNLLHFNVNGCVCQGDVLTQEPCVVYRLFHDPWCGGSICEITDKESMRGIMSMALNANACEAAGKQQ